MTSSVAESQDADTLDSKTFSPAKSDLSTRVIKLNDSADKPLLASLRRYPRRVLYILLMIPAILLIGYNLVIAGAMSSMPYFDLIYGEQIKTSHGESLIIPATWLGLWNGIGALGTMVGAGFGGWVHDRFGRRISMGIGASISAFGILVIFLSAYYPTIDGKRAIFLVGKILEGFSIGQLAATTQTYLSEITPNSLLGPVSALFPALILTGQLIGARIVSAEVYVFGDWGYKTCMLSMFPFAAAVLLVSFIMPESPTWLVHVGRSSAARRAIKRLELADADVEDVFYKLQVVIELEKKDYSDSESFSLAQCFRGVDARRTWIVILCNVMTNMFGVTFFNTATYFYELQGMEAGMAIQLLEVGIGVGIAANFISVWTMTKFHRRPLMIGTFIVIALFWFGIGVSGFFPTTTTTNYISATALMAIIFISGLGVWPTSIAVSSEASSLRLRGQTQAIGWVCQNMVSGIMGIVLPYIYTPGQGNSGCLIGFMFFGFSTIGAVLAWLYVPEMKNRSASEVNAMFNAQIETWRFRQWKETTDMPEESVDRPKRAVEVLWRGSLGVSLPPGRGSFYHFPE